MKKSRIKGVFRILAILMSLMLILTTPVTAEAKGAGTYAGYIKKNGVYYSKMPKKYRKGYKLGRKEYKANNSTGYGANMDELYGRIFFLADHVSAFSNSSRALSVRESKQTYAAAKSLSRVAKGKKSKYKKALALHDALMNNVTYGGGIYGGQSAYEALTGNKTAVCAGISRAYKLMCDIVGIKCYCVYGNAGGGIGTSGAHQWNVIKLDDGKWYEVDVTFDLGLNKSHHFFCLSTNRMANLSINGLSYYHQRAALDQTTALLMKVTPVATGTKYKYKGKKK